jgi:putative FmdB family regulatory protein
MPLYEYVCQKCERRTEVIQAFGERRIRMCPHCGGKVKKAFSAPAIQFKGSGFYITDYPKGKTGDNASSSPGKSESGQSESGSSEPGKSETAKSESGKPESSEKPAEKPAEKKKETKGKKPAKD